MRGCEVEARYAKKLIIAEKRELKIKDKVKPTSADIRKDEKTKCCTEAGADDK